MYFLIYLISVAVSILVTGSLYMRQLYLLKQYTDANGLKDYLSFKTVSGKIIYLIIISILGLTLLVGMSLSSTLTDIMNLPAIIITVLGSFTIPFLLPIGKVEAILQKQLPWAIVPTQYQPRLLTPENMTRTLKQVKSYIKYKKKYLKDINRSLENMIQSELKHAPSEDQAADTIVERLTEVDNSRIIPEIKADFFSTLISICESPENILYAATIISKALDAGIILTPVGHELDKIFNMCFQEIDKLSQEENTFNDSLLTNRKLFDLYVKCLYKLISQWEKLPPKEAKDTHKDQISMLAWGNYGIMQMFSRINSHLENLTYSPEQKKYYLEEFANKVIETLYDRYDRLLPFADNPAVKPSAVDDLFATYPLEYEKIRDKIYTLSERLRNLYTLSER